MSAYEFTYEGVIPWLEAWSTPRRRFRGWRYLGIALGLLLLAARS